MEIIKTSIYFTFEQIQISNAYIKNSYCTNCKQKNKNILQIKTKKKYNNRKNSTVIESICEDCTIEKVLYNQDSDSFLQLTKELPIIRKKIYGN